MNETLEAMQKIRTNKEGRYKYNAGLYLLIAGILLTVTVVVTVVGTIGYAMIRQRVYWRYVEEFSNSTVYAFEHEGVMVTTGEGLYLLRGDDVYVPYRLLGSLPMGKKWKSIPEDAKSILFEFGDGSSMEVWNTPIENSSKGYQKGLCIRYCNQSGKVYQFDVEGVTCEDIQKALPAFYG